MNAKIADLQARMNALAAEMAALADDEETAQPSSGPGIEVTNLAENSERLKQPKPVPHTAEDARREIKRRFPDSSEAASSGEDTAVEPPRDSSRADGAAEAARRFGKGH